MSMIKRVVGAFKKGFYNCQPIRQMSMMYSNLPQKGPHSRFTRNWFLPEFIGSIMREC